MADPFKTTNPNATIQLGNLPCWVYFHRPLNIACHNLCTVLSPPQNFKTLLGMGLTFCPRPSFTTADLASTKKRLMRDLSLKMFFAHRPSNFDDNKLFIKSDFNPPASKIPSELTSRLQRFFARLATRFRRRRSKPNLLQHQQQQLRILKQDERLIVVKTDKNLGPAIIERSVYV